MSRRDVEEVTMKKVSREKYQGAMRRATFKEDALETDRGLQERAHLK